MKTVVKFEDVKRYTEVAIAPDTSTDTALSLFFGELDVSASTLKSYRSTIQKCREWLLDNVGRDLLEASKMDLKAYKDALVEAAYKTTTIHTYLVSVKRFYTWLAAFPGVENKVVNLRGPRQGKDHLRDALTAEQARATVAVVCERAASGEVSALRDKALYLLLLVCGLRTVEAVRADVSDITSRSSKTVMRVQGKGHADKDDFVVLPAIVLNAIEDYLAKREASLDEPLFIGHGNRNHGQRLTTRTVSKVCKEIMLEAGIDSPRLTAHSLRHTAVTQALLAGATIQEAQALARHSSIQTTQTYAHNIERLNNPAVELAASYL